MEQTNVNVIHYPGSLKENIYSLEDNPLINAPHTAEEMVEDKWKHCYSKEVAFYPDNRLIDNKYWPPVKRIDNVYGDRNLFCACPPIDEYENINKNDSG